MTANEDRHFEPKNHPGIKLNMSYGQCACFMCRDVRVTAKDRDRLLELVAQDVARKPAKQADQWLGEWAMRHGPVALGMLRQHVVRKRQLNVGGSKP